MALCPTGESTFDSLYESIKTNGGVIHPIILNKIHDGSFVVVEGNTRVQIYRELRNRNALGDWDRISSIIYKNLPAEQIHAIRLQSHLVGPRDWDPYSKAKYLNYLYNTENMPINQIIAFCGGKAAEVQKMIKAYNDMEQYYTCLYFFGPLFNCAKSIVPYLLTRVSISFEIACDIPAAIRQKCL